MKTQFNIKNSDIDKRIRFIGKCVRKFNPYFTEEKFKKCNKLMDKHIKGHWLDKKTKVETVYLNRNDGTKLRVLICRSKKKTINKPLTGVLWLHGGGYAIGLPEQDYMFASLFSRDGSSITILPDYTRSIDAPYPAALEDCYLTLKWMHDNAGQLGINKNQIFVGGESAGGGLAAALCIYARDKNEVKIAFQMPLYPMLDDRGITNSSKNNDAPVWNTKSNEIAWALYLKGIDKNDITSYAAPARESNLKKLPHACTYIGTIEPFYDETIEYFNRLRDAGVQVEIKEFKGCYHAFDLFGSKTKLGKEAKKFLLECFKNAQEKYK